MQKLFYARTRTVKQPERGTSRSAGIDFFMPEFTDDFLNDLIDKNPNYSTLRPGNYSYYIIKPEKKILIAPHERLMIPSGIKIRGHENIAINAHNKSGVGTKKGFDMLACVIGSTIIETNKGNFPADVLTKKFVKDNNILIKSYTEAGVEYKEFSGFIPSGEKPCIKLYFDNGESIEVSEDHQILTTSGWTCACNISPDDDIIEIKR